MRIRNVRVAAALACAVALVGGCSDGALIGAQIVGTFPATTTVGQTRPVTVQLTNSASSGATVTGVRVLPACAGNVDLADGPSVSLGLGCGVPDAGVFFLAADPSGPLSGDCGGATGFTVGPADGEGIVPLTPTPANSLVVPAGGTCTVHLRQTTLRLPTVDVDPATDGIQTFTAVGVAGTSPGELDEFGTPGTVTVQPAPTPAPTPAPAAGRGGASGTPDESCGAITDRPEC